MARLSRLSPIHIPQHIIQRGNNRQVCFAGEQDYSAYSAWLKEYAAEYHVEVHAWVFMTNHVHLLCTPRAEQAISRMMQSLGRCYVRYFNHTYQRTGTLWEGRYKACLVQEDDHLLQVYRYIELNSVRAGMVANPADYPWSSYPINAGGKVSDLCTPHPLYLALGSSDKERQAHYRALVAEGLGEQKIKTIRLSLNKGIVLGDGRFADQIAALTGNRLATGKPGRPVGWRKNKDNLL
jgi:putative transposase